MSRPIPDVLLERYVLNELPAAAAAAIEREIAGNPSLATRVAELVASDAEIRTRYAPVRFLRPGPSRRPSIRGLALAGALTAAVVTMLMVIPRLPPADGDRIKGVVATDPSLAVYRRTSGGSERLADGGVVHPGDLLRVGYVAAGRAYGVILSIDGVGAVTLHMPPAGDRAVPLAQAPLTLLDTAYELDESPRIERFYFITGADAFSVAPILAAARSAHAPPQALPLSPGLEQVTFSVQKELR